MMKKLLPLGLLIGMVWIANSAQAVHLSPSGRGEVLLYPYYTVENGQDTYFSIANTTDVVKAVRVRLRESMNSAAVLSFNLYLSPFDHWAGVITRDPDGAGGLLKTSDTSCTVPVITATGIKLSNFSADGGPQGLERTREGFIEVIEMGVLDDVAPNAFGAEAAATHSANGVPANCGLLRAAWQEIPPASGNVVGDWSDPTSNMLFNANLTGGLYGYGVLINVPEGTNATYDAVALNGFADEILHSHPGNDLPDLSSAVPQAKFLEKNKFITLEFDSAQSGLDAVSSVLMQNKIANDFVLERGIFAGTDWVVTLPTKREYVNLAAPALQPFLNIWTGQNKACEQIPLEYRDRERGEPIFPMLPDWNPWDEIETNPLLLCTSTNVISFLSPDVDPEDENLEGYSSTLYPSTRTQALKSVRFNNGWAILHLDTDNSSPANARILEAADGTKLYGLPVIGFAVQKYTNGNLQGVNGAGAYYSGIINHKTTRKILAP